MAEKIFPQYDDTLNNKNIQFLQGSQSNVNKMMKGSGDPLEGTAKEGSFYLTQDTHRLYVGRKGLNNDNGIYPVPVNEGISTVTSVSALPANANQGEFYYISNDNILAVCSGYKDDTHTEVQWVQLNVDTAVTGISNTISSASGVYSIFTKLGVNGVDAYNGHFNVIEGSNISLSVTTSTNNIYNLTIDADDTTYTLNTIESSTAGVVKMLGSNSAEYGITFTGANGTSITSNSSNNVLISGPAISGNKVSTSSGYTGFRISTIVNNVDVTAGSNDIVDPQIIYGVTGVYNLTAANSVKFTNGSAYLDVYTSGQVDSAIAAALEQGVRELDAMVYRGTLHTSTAVPTVDVRNGDTYKIVVDSGESTTYAGHPGVRTGDLLIAQGTEATATGFIPSNSITWDWIPAGDEPVFMGALEIHGFRINSILNNVTAENAVVGMKLLEGNKIELSDSGSGLVKEVTISHAATTRSDTANTAITSAGSPYDSASNTGITFFALDTNSANYGIITDTYGHITGIAGRQVTIKDTHSYLKYLQYESGVLTTATGAISGDENGVYVKLFTSDTDDQPANSAEKLAYKSSTLAISGVNSGTVSQGTRATSISIDLKWGSF